MQPESLFRRSPRRFPGMHPARRRLVIAGLVASALLFLGGFVLTGTLWKLSRQFPQAPFPQPSRLYGAAAVLAPDSSFSAADMEKEVQAAGYREVEGSALPLAPGTYRRDGDRVEVRLRRFPTPEGKAGGGVAVAAEFRAGRVRRLWVAGRPAESVALEPPLLASFYDDKVEERRPVRLDELPEPVVQAVLAAEDDSFFLHPGVSPTGIARAMWTNLKGEGLQGGSTITQQLVKNLYLTSQRTLTRKGKEAVIAVMLEARHGKRAILEAYLNEIYLGHSGPANLIGLGAAAHAYFGKDAAELSLGEAATLAGMIQAPGDYSPVAHPQEARNRRDWVLRRMADLGWISEERQRFEAAQPLRVDPRRVEPRPLAPYFAEAARAEAEARFGVDELEGKGYLLFSTLRQGDQRQAEAAVAKGLAGLARGWERGRRTGKPLQAALVSADPRDGAILAWVGGRDYAASQFDRVAQARRQAGSAFKPVVFAAAFADGVATPATLLKDSPITVRYGRASWQPQNYDESFHGLVTARTALEQSLNIPTVRLALQAGLYRVVDLARDMGIAGDLEARPSLALGAFEVSPLEMAGVYSAFAADGLRPPLHGLAGVVDPEGEPVLGDSLPAPRRVLPPQAAWLVTSALRGAVDHGTGAGARGSGLAGKTGTTNDRRDSWFAGYSPDRVTVVWVGYDDNSKTRLSGARAALPIWSRFTAAVRPAAGYLAFATPPGMTTVTLDPLTGQLATDRCPHRVTETLPEWQAPMEPCLRHSPGFGGEMWADLSLGQPLMDPLTGARIDPARIEEARYTITDDGLQITDPGGDGTIVIGQAIEPARTFPPHPVEITPEEAMAAGGEEGSILIRPARPQGPPPASPPPEAGVVPEDGEPIGAIQLGAGGTEGGPPPP